MVLCIYVPCSAHLYNVLWVWIEKYSTRSYLTNTCNFVSTVHYTSKYTFNLQNLVFCLGRKLNHHLQQSANEKTTFGPQRDFQGHVLRVRTSCSALIIATIHFAPPSNSHVSPKGLGFLYEVPRPPQWYTNTQYGSTGLGIGQAQRPVPDNTQHSKETNTHAPGGIRTCNKSKRTAVEPRLRRGDQWKWQWFICNLSFKSDSIS